MTAYCFCPVCLFVCLLLTLTFPKIFEPGSNDRGHIVFALFVCLSVCLSVVNFNLPYNFWTVRDRDFIFGMYTQLMMPFQMTPRSIDLVTLTLTLKLKIAFSTLLPQGHTVVFHKHPLIFYIHFYICENKFIKWNVIWNLINYFGNVIVI